MSSEEEGPIKSRGMREEILCYLNPRNSESPLFAVPWAYDSTGTKVLVGRKIPREDCADGAALSIESPVRDIEIPIKTFESKRYPENGFFLPFDSPHPPYVIPCSRRRKGVTIIDYAPLIPRKSLIGFLVSRGRLTEGQIEKKYTDDELRDLLALISGRFIPVRR